MAIFQNQDGGPVRLHKPVITIGTFDGVHLGHRRIFEEVISETGRIGGESMVITFEPHPRQVLQPQDQIKILTPLPDKLDLIQTAGIQHVSVTAFTHDFSQLSADEYVEKYLVAQFQPACIVIGYDHHFGHDRAGNIELLRQYSEKYGFSVHEIPAELIRDAAISSTRIRKAISSGDVNSATQMLGRPYALRGRVVAGDKIGRTIGFPTANIEALDPAQLVPGQGVYAVRILLDGNSYGAMLSIGTRPTITDSGKQTIEACLFEFSEDIYDRELQVQFVQYMREELKFDGLEALKEAIRQDEIVARGILAAH
jgi:riboflavin kinase/FMN adenylyltransferase